MLAIMGGLGAMLAVPAAFNLIWRRDVRRVAVRNVARRPVESLLVIVGSALATAIIAAAFMVGDTFDSSIRDIARRDLGEVDVVLEVDDPRERLRVYDALRAEPIDGVDGVLRIRRMTAAAMATDETASTAPDLVDRVEPRVTIGVVDPLAAAAFGSDPAAYALPQPIDYLGERRDVPHAVINTELAEDLAISVGDRFTIFAGSAEYDVTVLHVLERQGLGGMSDVWVFDEWFDQLPIPQALVDDAIAVSLDGTVFDSVETPHTIDPLDALDATDPMASMDPMDDPMAGVFGRLFESEPTIEPTFNYVKQDLINNAADEGDNLTATFSVVGGFSVLAGVLLLVNLFVMLAEERKPTLGVMRAIGWKRSALRRSFRAEGLIYALPAAAVGSLLGVGLGAIMIRITRNLFASSFPDGNLELRTAIEPTSLALAGLIGVVIAMAAIAVTSWRISRLNIVSAIRDLPEPRKHRSPLLRALAGLVLAAVGGLCLMVGLDGPNVFAAIVSVPLIGLGLAWALRTIVGPDRFGSTGSMILTVVVAAAVLVWGVLFFEIVAGDTEVDVEFFLLYGVVLVSAGVALATVAGSVLQRLATWADVGGVPSRLALAYPTSRIMRTASSLAMYSLIIFSLAFMAVMARSVEATSEQMLETTSAGFDLYADSNRTFPVTADDYRAVDGVESVTLLSRGWIGFDSANPAHADDPYFRYQERVTSPDSSILEGGGIVLEGRAERFGSDLDALNHVLGDSEATIVPTWFLDRDSAEVDLELGDTVTAYAADGSTRDLEIVGFTNNDVMWSGAWVSAELLEDLAPDAVASMAYISVADGSDLATVADRLESRFRRQGIQAEPFADRVNRILAIDLGFFGLLRGYLLLGLVIGIGGLAVTMFRAVRERRRQIGMLRSMGLDVAGIRSWFLGEAAFVSIMGIACGIGLGVLSAYFVVTQSGAIDSNRLPFEMPWVPLAVIIAIPLAASTLASIIPARRAATLLPSQALRLAD